MFVFAIGVTVALIVNIAILHRHGEEASAEVKAANKLVSDSPECSELGEGVLEMGGNAVDAAVVAVICQSMVQPHIAGLGGGGVMLVHQHRTNTTVVIDFRYKAVACCKLWQYVLKILGRLRVPSAQACPTKSFSEQ